MRMAAAAARRSPLLTVAAAGRWHAAVAMPLRWRRPRLALPIVAVLAALAVAATVGLEAAATVAALLLAPLGRRLQRA